jgi:hypothetical protein
MLGLRIGFVIVGRPERRQIPAEVQLEIAPNAVADITELAAPRLRIGPGQHWENHLVARLKLGSRRRPEPIDLNLRRGERFTVERRKTPGECIDKGVEVCILHCAVYPAIALGDIGIEVVGAEYDLKRPRAADQSGEPFEPCS